MLCLCRFNRGLPLVVELARRDDASNAATRVGHVTGAPWDEVSVGVHDGLTSRSAAVPADVEIGDACGAVCT